MRVLEQFTAAFISLASFGPTTAIREPLPDPALYFAQSGSCDAGIFRGSITMVLMRPGGLAPNELVRVMAQIDPPRKPAIYFEDNEFIPARQRKMYEDAVEAEVKKYVAGAMADCAAQTTMSPVKRPAGSSTEATPASPQKASTGSKRAKPGMAAKPKSTPRPPSPPRLQQ